MKTNTIRQLTFTLLLPIVLLAPRATRAEVALRPDRIETGGGLSFETNSARLRQESFTVLDRVAALMRQQASVAVEVQVHSDSRGSSAYNLRLSTERARAVYEYLLQRGISSSRIAFNGFGERCPVASNRTAAGRAQNRRVVFWRTDTGRDRPCPVPSPPPPPQPDPADQFPDPNDAERQLR